MPDRPERETETTRPDPDAAPVTPVEPQPFAEPAVDPDDDDERDDDDKDNRHA